jgi:hypothetical protein
MTTDNTAVPKEQETEKTDLVCESLELAAAAAGDISAAIYADYFARCPGSEALMSHIDHIVRGKMLEEVFRLLMIQDYAGEEGYLNFEMRNHRLAYSVEAHMYANLLDAILATVRTAAADAWTPAFEAAWEKRLADLTAEISARVS